MKRSTRRDFSVLILAVLLSAAASIAASEPIMVGTFDSRCVALAYYRTGALDEIVSELDFDMDEAVEAGDSVRIQELEDFGSSMQEMMHGQVFSTGDIDEIITEIWTDLPAIAEANEVDIIVSIWDVTYINEGAEFVDVTEDIVMLFDPDEEVLEIIDEMYRVPPVPIQMLDHQH